MKHTGFRLTDQDLAIVARLRERLGLRTSTDVIRYALRRTAQQEGLATAGARLSGRAPHSEAEAAEGTTYQENAQ